MPGILRQLSENDSGKRTAQEPAKKLTDEQRKEAAKKEFERNELFESIIAELPQFSQKLNMKFSTSNVGLSLSVVIEPLKDNGDASDKQSHTFPNNDRGAPYRLKVTGSQWNPKIDAMGNEAQEVLKTFVLKSSFPEGS